MHKFKMLAYAGAIFVPIAVPRFCLKTLLPKQKTFSFNTKSNSCFRCSLGMGRLSEVWRACRLAFVPSSCGMFK